MSSFVLAGKVYLQSVNIYTVKIIIQILCGINWDCFTGIIEIANTYVKLTTFVLTESGPLDGGWLKTS